MRRFSILDLFFATAVVALHFAAFSSEAKNGGSAWAGVLFLAPTAITCLLHLRLRLKIPSAMVVHYLSTVVWSFLHAVGLNLAMNAYYLAGPNSVTDVELAVYDNAWDDTKQAIGWGIVLAATYGGICYTAITASGDCGSSTITCPLEDGREPSVEPELAITPVLKS